MFEGFSQEALDFLNDIRFNNNQTFYEANKARYERYVKQPMRELSDELAPVVQLIDPKLDTRPGRTMSRIRRDTRYTKDKSPFRDHAWLGWRYPGEGRGEGFHMYWGFGPDWLGWGCGCYYPDKPLMDALRLHIRKEADDVRRCLRALDGRFEMYGEDAKQAAELLDVNLTTRNIPGAGRVEMCGVPSHNLEMYVEKLRDKYDVTIAEAPDFRGERHIYTLRSIDHEAEASIDVQEDNSAASIVCLPCKALPKPRKIWLKITPLLPLAPFKEPKDNAAPTASTLSFFPSRTSFAAVCSVSDILMPVSPSGTGNTFKASIAFLFFSKNAAATQIISCSSWPLMVTFANLVNLRNALQNYRRIERTQTSTHSTFIPVIVSTLYFVESITF